MLRTNLSNTASSVNRVLGLEVGNQNLYGSEPSIDCTFDGGNMRQIQATTGNVLQIRNQNFHGSESCIDSLYWGDNPHSAFLFQNKITEVQESCSGLESNINYDEGWISNLFRRTRFNLNTRVGAKTWLVPDPVL